MPDETQPKVSILIVNYNGEPYLPACLDSLQPEVSDAIEVVVVDNASRDGSVDLLRSRDWLRLVCSETNLGFAGGNNLGLAECRGELVLLLNPDTVVEPGFLRPLREHLERNPGVAVVQGRMILPRHENRLDCCGSFLTCFGLLYHYGYFKPDQPKYHGSFPVFGAKGAFLMFRRSVLDDIGGRLFDEDYFCYYEETDFCHRVWLAGHEVHYVGATSIRHLFGAASERQGRSWFSLRLYLRNQTVSLLSNLSMTSVCWMFPLYYLTLVASGLAALLRGQGGKAGAHWPALTAPLGRMGQIRRGRALQRRIRKVSDAVLFAQVRKTPGLSYFLHTLQGRPGEYEDRD